MPEYPDSSRQDDPAVSLPPKGIKNSLLGFWNKHAIPWRIIAAAGLIIAVALCLSAPAHMFEPDDWAYYYAIHNFAQGKLVVNDTVHSAQVSQTEALGGQLFQYVSIGGGKWALEKAPGYPVYEIPFELLGIPRWGNVVLALGVTLATFILLKRLRDEKAACIGSLLMLFTPVSLVMLNRSYMDGFAAGAFLVIGGALYIYWVLERERSSRFASAAMLFLAFLFIAWSVVTRYTDVTVAIVFALHFAILEIQAFLKRQGNEGLTEIAVAVLGIAIPLAFLLIYDKSVFGSPFNYGYQYTQGDISFAFQHIGSSTQASQSVFWNIIRTNLKIAPHSLFTGFPLLIIAIPGFAVAIWAALRRHRDAWYNLSAGLTWDILLILLGWFAGVFLLYITYEWTANMQMDTRPFIVMARFYLPGLFPLAVVSALLLSKIPTKLALGVTAIAVFAGSVIFLQSLHNQQGAPRGGTGGSLNGPNGQPGVNRPTGLPSGLPTGIPSTRPPPTGAPPVTAPPRT